MQGTVTIDGALADHGTVAFYPDHGGAPAYGNIAKNGSYSMRVGQGNLRDEDASRIHAGDYVVTVVVNTPAQNGETMGDAGPPKPGPRMMAQKYGNKDTSPLHVTVKSGPNIVPLDLEGASLADAEKSENVETKQGDTESPAAAKPNEEHSEGSKP